MKKILIGVGAIAAALLVAYVSLSIYVITNQSIQFLLICADRGGLIVPFSKQFCRSYFYAFRGTQKDIDELHNQSVGASLVVQMKDTLEREKALRFLLNKGLDINRFSPISNMPPLHGSVLTNSPEEVRLLLANGARTDIKDGRFGLTPLELANKLQEKRKLNIDRTEVIKLLEGAK